jgi:hypothetical protein
MVVSPLWVNASFPGDLAEGLVGSRRSSTAIAVTEVAAEQREAVSVIKNSTRRQNGFHGRAR